MKSKLYVVGIGPGGKEFMTEQAAQALNASEIIVGYTVYADLVKEYYPDKKFITTPMKREKERCEIALTKAQEGKTVAMVCSGDSGVYGMAGLILELGEKYKEVFVEIVPGITAASSGAAVLGAPLIHDFAVISLSDLLTPWETIEKRLHSGAAADFVICLYNPSSHKRSDYLEKACDIILEHRNSETICGYVKNIGREGQTSEIMTLKDLRTRKVDMFTTVYIGNSQTRRIGNSMVTPRGYR